MKLEIWGLGHAGLVCAAGLARQGHTVAGVDVDLAKIRAVNAGKIYFREPGLAECVKAVAAEGRLTAGSPADGQATPAELVFLCLPTPAKEDGQLDTSFLLTAAQPLAERLRTVSHFQTIIVRSTVPVHFTREVLGPFLERSSGKKAGRDFGLAMIPEFLREGHALADFDDPPLIVAGTDDPASQAAIAPLFPAGKAQFVSSGTAEFFKLTNNSFHALKISFANELARLAHLQSIDGGEVLRLLCEDTRFNLSPAYLKPGFAYGGACLEKDLGALQSLSAEGDAPLLAAVSTSNRRHLEACLKIIQASGAKRIGFYGITNKPGSDDLRNSPALKLLTLLGAPVWICDPDLGPRHAAFLEETHGVLLLDDPANLQGHVDLVVNFRSRPLSLPPDLPQLHFPTFWRTSSRQESTPFHQES